MSKELTIGYSPCPNDTFIFYALIHGKVNVPGVTFREQLEDVETLNRMALEGVLDFTKVSYHALGHLREPPRAEVSLCRDCFAKIFEAELREFGGRVVAFAPGPESVTQYFFVAAPDFEAAGGEPSTKS